MTMKNTLLIASLIIGASSKVGNNPDNPVNERVPVSESTGHWYQTEILELKRLDALPDGLLRAAS